MTIDKSGGYHWTTIMYLIDFEVVKYRPSVYHKYLTIVWRPTCTYQKNNPEINNSFFFPEKYVRSNSNLFMLMSL